MNKSGAYLKRILKRTMEKIHYIILISLVCGLAFYFGLYLIIPPVYTANVTVYVNNSLESDPDNKKNVTQTDLLVSEKLVPTYMRMLRSNPSLYDISRRCGLHEYTPQAVNRAMYFSTVPGTAILRIYMDTKNPEHSMVLANSVIGTLTDIVSGQIEGSSVGVIDYASVPLLPKNQNSEKNALFGMILGAVFAALYFNIKAAKNAVISSEDDLEKLTNLPVLVSVPCLLDEEKPEDNYK